MHSIEQPQGKRNMTHLIVETRNNYGNEAIYPVNNAAKALATIAGTKTLRLEDIRTACLSLGCTVALSTVRTTGPVTNSVMELASVLGELETDTGGARVTVRALSDGTLAV